MFQESQQQSVKIHTNGCHSEHAESGIHWIRHELYPDCSKAELQIPSREQPQAFVSINYLNKFKKYLQSSLAGLQHGD